jgi:hypothetical protein
LLEDLNDFGWTDPAGFADQQVNMFGHNDVAYEGKAIPGANFFENLHRQISRADGGSIRAKALSRHKLPCSVCHRVIARVVEDRSSEFSR